jgi:hypothetical protein
VQNCAANAQRLFVLGFNYTRLDIRRSRSLGVMTRKRTVVREARRLIETDEDRSKTFKPRKTDLVISPENAQLHRRLHVRAMVRDGRRAFIGSQSLRRLELDERREIGLIIRDLGRHTAPELDRRPAYLGFHPEQAQQLLQR